MDTRIQCEADLQKLVHCDIIKVDQSAAGESVVVTLVLKSFDETIFQVSLVPGLELVPGHALVKPSLIFVTKEIIEKESK